MKGEKSSKNLYRLNGETIKGKESYGKAKTRENPLKFCMNVRSMDNVIDMVIKTNSSNCTLSKKVMKGRFIKKSDERKY